MTANHREVLAQQYAAAVQIYLAGREESALERAYEIGRDAVSAGIGLLEMTAIQRQVLAATLRERAPADDAAGLAERMMDFFGECMGAFEMVYRGYQDANEALRRSEAQIRLLTDSLPVLIAYFDREARCRFANKTCALWYAQPKEGVIGKSLRTLAGGAAFESLQPQVTRALLGSPAIFQSTFAFPDGKTRNVEATFIPRVAEGEIDGFFVLIHDETERLATEAQLRHAQKMEAIGQLTGGIAHDFNNLLTVIVGSLDMLLELASKKQKILVEAALRAALRGNELTKRLLAFARQQPLSPQPINLNERLPALVSLLKRTLGETVVIRTSLAQDLWITDVDPSQVEDALVNLAINARDAMPEGGVLTIETRNVTLDADYAARNAEVTPGEYTLLSVTDTGSGMPAEVVERAFEPFFTTKSDGKGTGLGLSMVYGFARQSRGHAKIYSEVGHGTTINLYLPRSPSDFAIADDEDAERTVLKAGTESVLLVEDDDDVRGIVVSHLTDLGYQVQAVTNGPEAVAVLEGETPFDLLLTDVVMPGNMTGYELADRAATLRPGIKILLATGYAGPPSSASHTRFAGAPLIRKPFRKQDLADAVRAVIDGR